MIPVELISGLTTIEDLPARATDAEDDSQLIYGAGKWKKRRRFWICKGRRKICRRVFVARNTHIANRRCYKRHCGRAIRIHY